ncbi:hypothetical protein ACFZAR_36315 [Streptomyces sp. NPDC008222]|uniref:hypothetical protein n=1 Tax=Streptomyces sp. NPDC008222 TaxID=3364820 RepID=UPI0036E5DA31
MNRQSLTHAAIRGLFNGTLLFLPAYGAAWLVIGHPPIFWQIFLASEALEIAVRLFLRHRKRQEVRALEAAYDQPAYGDQ